MYWTFDLVDYVHSLPFRATKKELIDFCFREGLPMELIQNLEELPDDDTLYHSAEDIWPDCPSRMEYYYGEDDEY